MGDNDDGDIKLNGDVVYTVASGQRVEIQTITVPMPHCEEAPVMTASWDPMTRVVTITLKSQGTK